jgi:type II secretory pathway pseudopilin PulG
MLEILLVLALLLLVAAASWPSFEAWFQSQRLRQALDTVRTHWVKARTLAMEEGRPYRFAWEAGGTNYRLAPDDLEDWPDLAGTAGGPQISAANYGPGLVVEGVLPEGVQFLAPGGEAGGWARDTVVFQPDGSVKLYSADGSEPPELAVAFVDRSGQARALQVRGLTGVITVVSLEKVP